MTVRSKVYLVIAVLAAAIGGADAAAPAPDGSMRGLSYSPSGIHAQADLEKGVPESVIRADLERLRAVTPRIRTYTVDRGLDRVPAIARTLGLKVSLGLWLGKDIAKNDREVTRGLEVIAAHPGTIDRVFVGNETVERGDLTAEELGAYIGRVKAAAAGARVGVGTAETWSIWLRHRELGHAVDFIGVHLLPYWDGVPSSEATDYVARRFDEITAAFPGKKIVIAETGWPSAGERRQGAVPSQPAQADFIRGFLVRAAKENYDFYIVEAFDQPWKATSFESSVGPHWGLFDVTRQPKFNWNDRRRD